MQEEYFSCSCSSPEHTLRFALDKEDGDLYTEVYLHQYRNIFKRIWVAIKYIAGYTCRYGHFDCFLMDIKDLPRMRKLLDEFEVSNKKALDKLKRSAKD